MFKQLLKNKKFVMTIIVIFAILIIVEISNIFICSDRKSPSDVIKVANDETKHKESEPQLKDEIITIPQEDVEPYFQGGVNYQEHDTEPYFEEGTNFQVPSGYEVVGTKNLKNKESINKLILIRQARPVGYDENSCKYYEDELWPETTTEEADINPNKKIAAIITKQDGNILESFTFNADLFKGNVTYYCYDKNDAMDEGVSIIDLDGDSRDEALIYTYVPATADYLYTIHTIYFDAQYGWYSEAEKLFEQTFAQYADAYKINNKHYLIEALDNYRECRACDTNFFIIVWEFYQQAGNLRYKPLISFVTEKKYEFIWDKFAVTLIPFITVTEKKYNQGEVAINDNLEFIKKKLNEGLIIY